MLNRVLLPFCLLALTVIVLKPGCMAQNTCDALRNCTSSLTNFDYTQGIPLTNMDANDASILDVLCEEVQTAHACVNDTIDLCKRRTYINTARSVLDVGDYVCDPLNRDVMEGYLQSDCVTNSTVRAQFHAELEGCLMTFATDVQDEAESQVETRQFSYTAYCPHFHRLEDCLVNTATDECGQSIGEYTSTIWDIATQSGMPTEFSSCFTRVQTTRRALEHLLPAIAKRHFAGWDDILSDWD